MRAQASAHTKMYVCLNTFHSHGQHSALFVPAAPCEQTSIPASNRVPPAVPHDYSTATENGMTHGEALRLWPLALGTPTATHPPH